VAKHHRDDYRVHAPAAELGGDGVAHVVQPRCRVQPGFAGEAFERAGERVRVDEEPIPAVAHERERPAELVERVTPSRAQGGSPPQLFASVQPDPLKGEGGKLNDPT